MASLSVLHSERLPACLFRQGTNMNVSAVIPIFLRCRCGCRFRVLQRVMVRVSVLKGYEFHDQELSLKVSNWCMTPQSSHNVYYG